MVKLKKELILLSAVLIFILALAIVYAENRSGNCSGNGGCNGSCGGGCGCGCGDDEKDDEEICEGLDQTECVSKLECEYDDEDLECELKDNETEDNETDDDDDTDDRNRHTFLPWQKITEQECPEECSCHGAVMSCETETGKIMTITAGNSGNVITIEVNRVKVNISLELTQEGDNETNRSKFHVRSSNGRTSEIKIMPDVAAERALERLRLKVCNETNNCTIELKDVGNQNQEMLSYELQVQRHVRVLGIFQAKVQERAEIDAEDGTVKTHRPWWMFLATKQD
jgi:hypothetical protein